MNHLLSTLCGCGLDLLLGDPEALTRLHPVVWMGKAIRALEMDLRRVFPEIDQGELAAGAVLAFTLPVGVFLTADTLLRFLRKKAPPVAFLLETVWCWQALAMKNLKDEAMHVQAALESGSLENSRNAVSRIVGRDVNALSMDGVARAAVETVAENFSDGVAAPMLYLMLGGAPLGLTYKAINTMDSMVGYKNDRYLYFGRAAARLDDIANFLPARISALLLISSAYLTGMDGRNAYCVWKRDRRNHASPNSGQCEAAVAGALHLRLCGPASYFGLTYLKPYIGDNDRAIEPIDIDRACRMEYAAGALALLLFGGMRMLTKGCVHGLESRRRLGRL